MSPLKREARRTERFADAAVYGAADKELPGVVYVLCSPPS